MDKNKTLNNRLEVLYRKHNEWLKKVAYNFCKNPTESEDLVSELYIYLAEKGHPKMFYLDSFNLQYCRSFIKTRWLNKSKRDSKTVSVIIDKEFEEYDEEKDLRVQFAYDTLIQELHRLRNTPLWSSARLFEIYWFEGGTMEEVSKRIGVSKSTTFSNVKIIKQHMLGIIENPFKESINEQFNNN